MWGPSQRNIFRNIFISLHFFSSYDVFACFWGWLPVSLSCATLEKKSLNNRKLFGFLLNNIMFIGVVWLIMEGSELLSEVPWLSQMLRLNRDAERLCVPFCTILSTHIHGWTASLTGLIFFLPQSALLSCLRLEPAAAESCICSAWGLNLLLFPSSFICSFLVPPVCLIWHYTKAFLHLLIPPLVLKKKSQVASFHLVCAEICPSSCQNEFSSGTWIPKLISICSTRTDPFTRHQRGTRELWAHLKEKLTNRSGDGSNTNDTESQRS